MAPQRKRVRLRRTSGPRKSSVRITPWPFVFFAFLILLGAVFGPLINEAVENEEPRNLETVHGGLSARPAYAPNAHTNGHHVPDGSSK